MLIMININNKKQHLAHSVVCKFDVSLWIQQHVVQFQVSVDDSSLVEIVERQTDLCWVESKNKNKIKEEDILKTLNTLTLAK